MGRKKSIKSYTIKTGHHHRLEMIFTGSLPIPVVIYLMFYHEMARLWEYILCHMKQ